MTKEFSERQIISRIRKKAAVTANDLIKGIGDDCSVFGRPDQGPWLVSTDMLVDNVHFDRSWHDPRLLGRKCVAVNLSDIAAMGGVPRFLLISVSLPRELSSQWITEWFDGVMEILAEYDCLLIGGDTVTGEELNFSITVIGTQLPEGTLYRTGAREGDSVYVSGPLGSAAAGLQLFTLMEEKGVVLQKDAWQEVLSAHLDPIPQIELGQLLCRSGHVSSMQDISDGIATDLSHICRESDVKAVIYEEKLPCLPLLDTVCTKYSLEKLDLLLKGGEDYQLVFTVKKGYEEKIEALVKDHFHIDLSPIGVISYGKGVFLQTSRGQEKEISFLGYEHGL